MAAVTLAAAFVASWMFAADPADDAGAGLGFINGQVLHGDGETPLPNMTVRLWDADEERFLYTTTTDENGNFSVPRIAGGNLYLLIGKAKVDLAALETAGSAGFESLDLYVALPQNLQTGGTTAGASLQHTRDAQSDPNVISP